MIDPVKVTDYRRSPEQLEEFLLFCIGVANKNATYISRYLHLLLLYGKSLRCGATPFQAVRVIAACQNLPETMRRIGFGCFNTKARGFLEAANSGLDLSACSLSQLEGIHGVGMKTARYFVLHSRENARVACLDTHIKRWLAYYTGRAVPENALSRKRYLELEQLFLKVADAMGVAPATLDLAIWNRERGTDEESLAQGTRAKDK